MSDCTRLTDCVRDMFDGDEFADLLDEAELMAASDWEMEFVADLRERFDRYGVAMYLTERQRDKLEAIARG